MAATTVSCSSQPSTGRPVVTVSIAPQKYLLEQIAGDKVDINCLLARGGDPESYEPSIADMRDLHRSLVYFQAGNEPFEQVITGRFKNSGGADLKVVDTSRGIELIEGTHHNHNHHGHESTFDPHTWSSVKNARVIARNMVEAMKEADPSNSAFYQTNYERLDARLDSLDRSFTSRLAPFAGTSFLVWHPSLSYFARDYGLKQISVGSATKEISIPSLKKSVDEAARGGVTVFFHQPSTDSRQAEIVNSQLGARRVDINPLDGDWERQMELIVNTITNQR